MSNDTILEIIEDNSTIEIGVGETSSDKVIEIVDRQSIEVFNSSDVIFIQRDTSGGTAELGKIQKSAGYNISGHRALILNQSGQVEYASSSNPLHINRVIGISLNAAISGDIVNVRTQFEITEPSWNWTLNVPIFLGENGNLTQSPSSNGVFIQQLGYPISSTTIYVDLGICISIN